MTRVTGVTGVSVRTATPGDLEAVLLVGHRTWWATYLPLTGSDYVEAGLAKWWTPQELLPQIEAGRVLLAEQDGVVVGMASAGPYEGDLVLFKLYVQPEAQGHGVGTALLDRVLAEARRGGHQIIRLPYLDGNDSARGFYAARGFRETHRERTGEGLPDSVWVVRDVWEGAR